jgi:hypothetical protein
LDGAAKGATDLVRAFGQSLQNVWLIMSPDTVAAEIQRAYAPFVSPQLLAFWMTAPDHAPGRRVSSPWPDHIDVVSAEVQPDGAVQVTGRIIEMTSTEIGTGRNAGAYPVAITVARDAGQGAGTVGQGGRWRITSFAGQWPGHPGPE